MVAAAVAALHRRRRDVLLLLIVLLENKIKKLKKVSYYSKNAVMFQRNLTTYLPRDLALAPRAPRGG